MEDTFKTSSPKENTRNWRHDYLKGIACIVVILLHCPLPGAIGELIIYAFRFSVPIFFMITGYYTHQKTASWIFKKTIHLIRTLLCAELFYFIFFLISHLMTDSPITPALKELSLVSAPIKTILCGSMFNGTLWYFYAAIWCNVLLYILFRTQWINIRTLRIILISLLITFQVVGRFYYQNHYDINSGIYLFNNAISFALPLTLLGYEFADIELLIKERISIIKDLLLIFFGNVLIIIEFFISGQYMDFHFSTLVISSGLFIFALIYTGDKAPLKKLLSYIGNNLSLFIYLIHYFFIKVFDIVLGQYSGTMLRPLSVVALSILSAYLHNWILKKRLNQKTLLKHINKKINLLL